MNTIPPQASPDTLELQEVLTRSLGSLGSVQISGRHPYAYQTSHALEEIEVVIGGSPLSVLFKNLSRRAFHQAASTVKPEFLHDPVREIVVYQEVLSRAASSTARCYAAVADAAMDRYWLFIEKIPGIELYQIGDLRLWQDAARWLASFHQRTSEALSDRVRRHLITYDGRYYRRWLERACSFSHQGHASLALAEARFEDLIAGLNASPRGFLHGEPYASNVLIDTGTTAPRICPIDWEMAGDGPVLIDLAALTAGGWNEHDRGAIAGAYYEASDAAQRMPRDHFMRSLACCHAALALQWLGWADGWVPPAEHRRDWHAELRFWLDRM